MQTSNVFWLSFCTQHDLKIKNKKITNKWKQTKQTKNWTQMIGRRKIGSSFRTVAWGPADWNNPDLSKNITAQVQEMGVVAAQCHP